jgi:hypothetical protein
VKVSCPDLLSEAKKMVFVWISPILLLKKEAELSLKGPINELETTD